MTLHKTPPKSKLALDFAAIDRDTCLELSQCGFEFLRPHVTDGDGKLCGELHGTHFVADGVSIDLDLGDWRNARTGETGSGVFSYICSAFAADKQETALTLAKQLGGPDHYATGANETRSDMVRCWQQMVAGAAPDLRRTVYLEVVKEGVRAAKLRPTWKASIVDAQEQLAKRHDRFGQSVDDLQKDVNAIWRTEPATHSNGKTNGKSNGTHANGNDQHIAAPAIIANTGRDLARKIEISENGVAREFVNQHGANVRFNHTAKKWLVWDGNRWLPDDTKLAEDFAREFIEELSGRCEAKDRKSTTSYKFLRAVENFSQIDRRITVTSNNLDCNPMLLGTPAGTVDLCTGKLAASDPANLITKCVSTAPSDRSDCPRWLKFLNEATNGDADLIRFLQQFVGYSLTGRVSEHALLFIYGPGGNGKSVFLNTVSAILGDYCRTSAMDTFIASNNDRHPTDLAMLAGARMVCASETEEGRSWAESRIKQLTGGDKIAARFMRQDFFEFFPQFKMMIIGNHKPRLTNVTEAVRRRFNIIPFIHTPKTIDQDLEQNLRAEWPGILRWMIDGCLDWQKNGLIRAQVVIDTTQEYFSEQDVVRRWADDCCEMVPTFWEKSGTLYLSWKTWCDQNGEKPNTSKWFGTQLARLNCTPSNRARNGRGWKGIGLVDQLGNR